MKISSIPAVIVALISLTLPACYEDKEKSHEEHHNKIVVTSPVEKYVIVTQRYVCLILSQRHINVRALQDGYLEEIRVKEGQSVKKGELMFQILATIYKAKYEAEVAEWKLATLELANTRRLQQQNNIVSPNEVALYDARLARAKAKMEQAKAELDFCSITAPFDGIVDRLHEREGSLIKERDILTTLSDNSVMWVYFNVPERNYLEYMDAKARNEDPRIELELANGSIFRNPGEIGAIEAKFNKETGNIKFRADFVNVKVKNEKDETERYLLRNEQTGTVLIHRTLNDAIVIPQRATFERLDKRYVWVVGEDDVAHQRLITIEDYKLEDIFVIKSGLDVKDKIVLEGVREVHEDDKVEYEFRPAEEILGKQKNHAE